MLLHRELLEPLGLPGEHRVGHSLERLAEHHEAVTPRVSRAEMKVAQEAAAPSVTPLRREHHEVERVARLDLQPPGATPAGGVGSIECLDHDALVPGGQGGVEVRLGNSGVVRDHPRDSQRLRHGRRQGVRPLGEGRVQEVLAVQMQDVEQHRRDAGRARGDPRRGDLKRLGPAVGAHGDRLAVEHEPLRREPKRGGRDLRQARRQVVERPAVDRHVAAIPVHLDPSAVELPVHRGLAHALHRLFE